MPFLDSENVRREALITHVKDVDIYVLGVEKADRELIDAAEAALYHQIRRRSRQY